MSRGERYWKVSTIQESEDDIARLLVWVLILLLKMKAILLLSQNFGGHIELIPKTTISY